MECAKGISICTVSMNRTYHLLQTLPTWLKTVANEIVIVDWNSSVPIQESIMEHMKSDPRIKLYRVANAKKWVLSVAFNFCISLASFDKILKLDADDFLSADFFEYHPLQSLEFYCGNWRSARDENERHTNGIVYMNKFEFLSIHGYSEFITSYGYDDCDLYSRLSKVSKRKNINTNFVRHIKHSNEERSSNQDLQRLDIEIEKNRLISEKFPWKGGISKFETTKVDTNIYRSIRCHGLKMDKSVVKRYLEIATESRKHFSSSKKLFIEVRNGLGNRLRVLASAFNIARGSNRKLCIIWIPDAHCRAKFSELFQWSEFLDFAELIEDPRSLGFDELVIEEAIDIYQVLESDGNNSWVYYFFEEFMQNFDFYDYMDTTEKNKYIDDTVDDDLYIISACSLNNRFVTWQKDSEFLRKLQPQFEIQQTIDYYSEKFDISECIGVHIRMGQESKKFVFEEVDHYSVRAKESITSWREKSNWKVFARKMEEILRTNENQKFFVCCDNEHVYQLLAEEFKENVVFVSRTTFDRSKEQIFTAVVDMWLLSKCKYILGSNWSSFSEVSHRLSMKKMCLASVDFK